MLPGRTLLCLASYRITQVLVADWLLTIARGSGYCYAVYCLLRILTRAPIPALAQYSVRFIFTVLFIIHPMCSCYRAVDNLTGGCLSLNQRRGSLKQPNHVNEVLRVCVCVCVYVMFTNLCVCVCVCVTYNRVLSYIDTCNQQ